MTNVKKGSGNRAAERNRLTWPARLEVDVLKKYRLCAKHWAVHPVLAGKPLLQGTRVRDFPSQILNHVFHCKVSRCRVSEHQALPDPDANTNAAATDPIRLGNEGCKGDYEISGVPHRYCVSIWMGNTAMAKQTIRAPYHKGDLCHRTLTMPFFLDTWIISQNSPHDSSAVVEG